MKSQVGIECGGTLILCIHHQRIDGRLRAYGTGDRINDEQRTQPLMLITAINGQATDESGGQRAIAR